MVAAGRRVRVTRANEAPGARLATTWQRLRGWPGGSLLFSWIVGRTAPYTGTLGARFEELQPGYARVALRDRHRVRNHLNSIHAVALVNLGEVTSGTAMLAGLGSGVRGIVIGLSTEYLKKARGRLVAEARAEIPDVAGGPVEQAVVAEIKDRAGDVVARVTARWLLSPRETT
jgi:acyl-coenzyme A thioesterase PaaI-like protein